jgi:hypothetical protein
VATFTGVTISAAAGTSYQLVAAATGYANGTSNTFTVTVPSFTLTVEKAGAGTGTVTSDAGGIDCGTTCSDSYVSGTSVTLTAVAGANSVFTGWSGGGCTGTDACLVTVSEVTTVTATFALQQTFTLSVGRTGTGTGTVISAPAGISCGLDCSETYVDGTEVVLTATAAIGSGFGGWSGCTSTNNDDCIVVMDQSRNVTVTFTVPDPNITTTTLPNATANTPYSQALAVAGGAAPYTWSLAVGDTLATGLTLSPAGVISGTPAAGGQVAFTVQVSDAGDRTDAQALTLVVADGFVGGVRQLGFLVQPSNVNAGAAISPPVQVEVRDVNGSRVTTSTATVVMVFGKNAGNATLTGNVAQADAGVAIFEDLRVSAPGNGYTLVATSDGMESATSSGFRVR